MYVIEGGNLFVSLVVESCTSVACTVLCVFVCVSLCVCPTVCACAHLCIAPVLHSSLIVCRVSESLKKVLSCASWAVLCIG